MEPGWPHQTAMLHVLCLKPLGWSNRGKEPFGLGLTQPWTNELLAKITRKHLL